MKKAWILQRIFLGKTISYETQNLIRIAKENNIDLTLQDPRLFDVIVGNKNNEIFYNNNLVEELPDFVIPRMGATTYYYAMSFINQLENLGVPCINSYKSIEKTKDKLKQLQILSNHEISIPKTIIGKLPISLEFIENKLSFPVILKTLYGTQGNGVFLCENKNTLEDLTKIIEQTNRFTDFIVQEFISKSKGKDIRIFIVGNKILGAIQRNSSDDSFKANFSRGGTTQIFEIPEFLKNIALKIMKIFGLEIAGIDFLFDNDSFKLCEINSSPGFKGFESVHENINVSQEIIDYIINK